VHPCRKEYTAYVCNIGDRGGAAG
jgi:hypothetical protein